MAVPSVQACVRRVEGRLGKHGRVVLRASGTEPVIRVMIEAEEEPLARETANEIAAAVRDATP